MSIFGTLRFYYKHKQLYIQKQISQTVAGPNDRSLCTVR